MLLIFPPQWTPISPHFAIPSLLGQLNACGYNAKALDLNIDFFDTYLTKEKIEESIVKAYDEFEYLKANLLKVFSPDKKANDYTLEEQIFLYRYNKIKNYFQNSSNYLKLIPSLVDEAKNVLKNDEFYNPVKLVKNLNIIIRALEIISLPYSPVRVEFESIQNPFFKFNFETIKYFVFDKTTNIFIDYYKNKTDEIIKGNYDFIALSINSSSQIVPGLTLANMLKKSTKAHINIGGNFFGRIANELMKHKEFFDLFADSLSIEEGEGPIVEIAKFVNNEIPINKVPNLLYVQNGKVIQNEKMKSLKLDEIAPMDLTGYELNKYLSPELVMPFQSSRGCYWGKCSFCDQDFGQNFSVKSTEKIINELKLYKDKYNISFFEFIDESVSPTALNSLSDKLIENNMDVKFFMDARLETGFNAEILNKASKAGLKMILWGLESGSRKVLELINKGIDIDRRFEIMQNTKNAGIWNFAFIFFGFPAETVEDAFLTIKMLVENCHIIDSYGRSVYTMGRHSKLAQEPEKYGITKIYPAQDEFSPNINFDCSGMTQKELKSILDYCITECSKAFENPLWMYLRTREWLFLYIAKYGVDWVRNYKLTSVKED